MYHEQQQLLFKIFAHLYQQVLYNYINSFSIDDLLDNWFFHVQFINCLYCHFNNFDNWSKWPIEKFFIVRHWCEENEMVFVSHKVPFPATSDRRSRVAGNGTEWEVKTTELSSPTSGGEQWPFHNFMNFAAVKTAL